MMMNNKHSGSGNQKHEYENSSHIAKKKKAEQQQFRKKNLKEIVDLIDEDEQDIVDKYARFIK